MNGVDRLESMGVKIERDLAAADKVRGSFLLPDCDIRGIYQPGKVLRAQVRPAERDK